MAPAMVYCRTTSKKYEIEYRENINNSCTLGPIMEFYRKKNFAKITRRQPEVTRWKTSLSFMPLKNPGPLGLKN